MTFHPITSTFTRDRHAEALAAYEAASKAEALYKASIGSGNSRVTVERLRRDWVLAVAKAAKASAEVGRG